MSPETVSAVASAIVLVFGGFTAIRASRSATRTNLLRSLLTAVAMLLFVRLIVNFGGWTDWFIYVWLLAMIVYVIAVYRAAKVWPNLPWRAENATTRRSEATGLGVSSALALAVTGALLVPGLMLS